ncbi:MAG: 16S rRNA (guanine(527)-N(7))-methyltransferase RsmG [Pirellulales bacterium]
MLRTRAGQVLLIVAAFQGFRGASPGGCHARVAGEQSRSGKLARLAQGCEIAVNDKSNDTLRDALARHNIELPDEQIERLDRYARALWSWNEKLNLTRHTTYEKFVARDVVDALALERFLESGERVLDVGTGGGVPGVVLAIVRPDLEIALCDSVAKKAKAARAIVAQVGLNVTVHHAPVQELLEREQFDTLVVRAVAPLSKLLGWLAPHWDAFNRLLVIKGPAWVEERQRAHDAGLLKRLQLRKLSTYPLPGTQSESVVLSIRPKE